MPTYNSPWAARLAGSGAGGLSYTTLDLSGTFTDNANNCVNEATSTFSTTSTIVMLAADPNEMNAPTTVPQCVGQISAAFDYSLYAQVQLRFRCASAPAGGWGIVLGLYDGTVATAQGLYGNMTDDGGQTGAEQFGSTVINGNAAATLVAGGTFSVTFGVDGDNSRFQNMVVTSKSLTGPAYGYLGRVENPTSWAGGALHWFFGFQGNSVKGAGTFGGVVVDYLLTPWSAA